MKINVKIKNKFKKRKQVGTIWSTLCVKWITIMCVLNMNSVMYNCMRKIVLSAAQ